MADAHDVRGRSTSGWMRWAVAGGVAAVLFAVLAMLVAMRDGRPLPGDLGLHDWSVGHRPDVARTIAVAITDTGSGTVPYLVALVAGALVGARAFPGIASGAVEVVRRIWGALAALLLLVALQLVRAGVMNWVGRPRPPMGDWVGHPTGMSFPSGHTTTSAAAALLLVGAALSVMRGTARAVVVTVAAVWAVLVGLTRIYLGVHWPTDVLGGWLLVAAAGCLFGALTSRRTKQDAQE